MENKLNLYGVYPAVVVNTQDPKGQGRVLLRVGAILGTATSAWAPPLGEINTPVKQGDSVIAQFIGGDVTQPVYSVANTTHPWESIYPTAWTSFTPYLTSIAESAVSTLSCFPPQYRFESETQVRLRGVFRKISNGNFSSNDVVFTLNSGPVNLVPSSYQYLQVSGQHWDGVANAFRIALGSDGTGTIDIGYIDAYPNGYHPKWVALDGITFFLS